MAEDGGRSMRVREKEVNYKEPQGNQGLYKIRPDTSHNKSREEDSGSDSDAELRPRGGKKGRGGGGQAQRTKQSPPAKQAAYSPGDSLFGVVRDKVSAVPMAVTKWWETFSFQETDAVEQLANLVLEASGCTARIPRDKFKPGDVDADEEVRVAIEDPPTEMLHDNMARSDKASLKLRRNLSEFWRKWVELAPRDMAAELQGNPFCKWLFAMSTSSHKQVRHSASIAGLAMMVGLASVSRDVAEELANKHRQLAASRSAQADGEAQKSKRKRLQEEVEGLSGQKNMLENEAEVLFNAVFVHRHRDTNPAVRAACIAALGEATVLHGPKFLTNTYLKYLGWSLHDVESAAVRGAGLDALAAIFETGVGKELDMFLQRFGDRVLQMRYDRDATVAERAIGVAAELAKRDVYDDKHTALLYKMLVDDNAGVRRAAAGLVADVYVGGDLARAYEEACKGVPASKRPDRAAFMLKGVVEMLQTLAGDFEDLSPACEALGEASGEWGWGDAGLMCEVLGEGGGDALEVDQKVVLARVLSASLFLSPTSDDAPPKGRRASGGDAAGASGVLDRLPGLIQRMGVEEEVLPPLLEAASRVDVSGLTKRHAEGLGALVDAVADAVLKSHDLGAIRAGAAALGHVSSEAPPALDGFLESRFASLADSLAKGASAGLAAICRGSKPSAVAALGVKRYALVGGCVDLSLHRAGGGGGKGCADAVNLAAGLAKHPAAAGAHGAGAHAVAATAQQLLWRLAGGGGWDPRVLSDERDSLLSSWCAVAAAEAAPLAMRLQAVACVGDVVRASSSPSAASLRAVDRGLLEGLGKALPGLLSEAEGRTGKEGGVGEGFSALMDEGMAFTAVKGGREGGCEEALCAAALSVQSAVLQTEGVEGGWDEAAADMVCALVLGTPHDAPAAALTLAFVGESLAAPAGGGQGELATRMLSVHKSAYARVQEAARGGDEDIETLTMRIVQSVSGMPLGGPAAAGYLKGALEWAVGALPDSSRLAFLDAAAVLVPQLSPMDAGDVLGRLEDLCEKRGVSAREAGGALAYVARMRGKLSAAAGGEAPGGWGSGKKGKGGASTPAARRASGGKAATPTSLPSLGDFELKEEGDGEGEGSPPAAGGGGGRKKARTSGSGGKGGGGRKGKRGARLPDEEEESEDEEGFVRATPAARTTAAGGRARRG